MRLACLLAALPGLHGLTPSSMRRDRIQQARTQTNGIHRGHEEFDQNTKTLEISSVGQLSRSAPLAERTPLRTMTLEDPADERGSDMSVGPTARTQLMEISSVGEVAEPKRRAPMYFRVVPSTLSTSRTSELSKSNISKISDLSLSDEGLEDVDSDESDADWQEISNGGKCKCEKTELKERSTALGLGNLANLKEHDITCNSWLSKWRLSSGGTATKLQVDYKCCNIGQVGACETTRSDVAESDGSLMKLADPKLNVACTGAPKGLTRWKLETTDGDAGRKLLIDYTCCETAGDMQFGDACEDASTPLAPEDDNIQTMVMHDVECQYGFVMRSWKMVRKQRDFSIDFTCCPIGSVPSLGEKKNCHWVGDPHFGTFDGGRHDTTTPTNGFYWVVKNDLVQIQSYYQGGNANSPMLTRGVAIGGKFLLGNKLIVKFDQNKLKGQNPAYRTSALPKQILWNDQVTGGGVFMDGSVVVTENGNEVLAQLPLEIVYKANRYTYYQNNYLTMPKLPGTITGHCGNFNGNGADDNQGSLAPCCQVEHGHNMFLTNYNGNPENTFSVTTCPTDKRTFANTVCSAKFNIPGPLTATFKQMCIFDVCNTPGQQDQMQLAVGDEAAEEAVAANMDLAKPREYKIVKNGETCPRGFKAAQPKSKSENRAILEAAARDAGDSERVILGAHNEKSKGGWKNIFGGSGGWKWDDETSVCGYVNWASSGKWYFPILIHKAGSVLCMRTSDGKWISCPEESKDNDMRACEQDKFYGVLSEAGPVTARSACGEGKQLAMPKTAAEQDTLHRVLQSTGKTSLMFLGGSYNHGQWEWDDGSPITGCDFSSWHADEPNEALAKTTQLFLCIVPGTGKWVACQGYTEKRDVVCETAPPEKRCPLSRQNMDLLHMNPLPDKRARYQDSCFYIAPGNTDCTSFCLKAFPGSYCDPAGITKIAQNTHTCKVVTDSFSVNTSSVTSSTSSSRVGCSFLETSSSKKVLLECPEEEGECQPTCDEAPVNPHQHRICACEDGSGLSYPDGHKVTPGDTVRVRGKINVLSWTISLVDSTGALMQGGRGAPACTFEMNPETQTITRSYKFNGEMHHATEQRIWPFDGFQEGDTFVVDLRSTAHAYQAIVNGVHVPSLDIPRGPMQFDASGVELNNLPDGHVALIESPVLPSVAMSMNSDNGCKAHPFPTTASTVTFYFFLHLKSTSDDGIWCIRCDDEDFNHATNIFLHAMKLTITVEGNAPRTQTFDLLTFERNRVYDVAIHYKKDEKVVELYVGQERVQFLFYDRVQNIEMGSGHLGCYGPANEKVLLGEIVEYKTQKASPTFRTSHAFCPTMQCAHPFKHKLHADEIVCAGSICLEADRDTCCDKLPKCNPDFVCPHGSLYKLNAGDVYCKDAVCHESNVANCCDPASACSTYQCPPGKLHLRHAETIFCAGQTCEASDEDKCCEPVANCSTYACPEGRTLKSHSLSIECPHRTCTDNDADLCCAELGKCTHMKCPTAYQLRPGASEIFCSDVNCSQSNWETCCAKKGLCASHSCPAGRVLKEEAEYVYCNGLHCDESDHDRCCIGRTSCNSFVCQPGWNLIENSTEVMCSGRTCTAADHAKCCVQVGWCSAFDCPPGYRHKPTAANILCDDVQCAETDYRKCCASDSACSSYTCPPSYVHKANASELFCNGFDGVDSDMSMCCDRAARCSTMTCPPEMALVGTAEELFCAGGECTAADRHQCCVRRGVCTSFRCPTNFVHKHNAQFLLCGGAHCNGTNFELCCAPQGQCSSYSCPVGYRNKEGIGLTCQGWSCTRDDRDHCCERVASCDTYQCPHGYGLQPSPQHVYCRGESCTQEDIHNCCYKEGYCLNMTCPLGYKHKPSAGTTLCDSRTCEDTPTEKCCALTSKCNSFTCPVGYVIKLNASVLDCKGWLCTMADLDDCCDPAMTCSQHECPIGSTLKAFHADLLCHDRDCTGEDHERCCVPQGHCYSYECPPSYLHRQNHDLLCHDQNCSDTEYTVCCDHEKKCSTYTCPQGFVHKDNAEGLDCAGFQCTDADRDTCCHPDATCTGYTCPAGLVIKALADTLSCGTATCSDNDRLQCCTAEGKCDSYKCPPGFQHRHDANDIFCEDNNCQETDFHICCVEEGHCHTHHCPAEYVHRINASVTFCEDWKCTDSDTDRCCDLRAHCNEQACPTHEVHKWNALDLLCINRTCLPQDNDECCIEEGKCTSQQCPPGYAHRHQADKIWCEDSNCTATDFHLCCGEEDKCHTYSCPEEYVHKPNAETLECQGFVCDETDTDTCCDHRAWCNSYVPEPKLVLKLDAAGVLCANNTCGHGDRDTCCDHEGTCLLKHCPESHLHKPNAHEILCPDMRCLDVDIDTCCQKKAECLTLACPAGYAQKDSVQPLFCAGFECTEKDHEVCCEPRAVCTDYAPPNGYFLKHNAAHLKCQGGECSDIDLHSCCAEAGMCSSYHCPESFILRHDARHIPCQDEDCKETEFDVCCAKEGTCDSWHCPDNHVHRADSQHIECSAEQCSSVDDFACCQLAATCNTFLCPVEHTHRELAQSIYCAQQGPETLQCSDADKNACCLQEGMCSTFPCPTGFLHRHNAHDIHCDDANCTVTDFHKCCAEQGKCPTYKCPSEFVHKEHSEDIHCRDDVCTDADKYGCCDTSGTCQFFACPTGYIWRDDYLTQRCGGRTCTAERDTEACCQNKTSTTGRVSQQTTTTVSVSQAVETTSEAPVQSGAVRHLQAPMLASIFLAIVLGLLTC